MSISYNKTVIKAIRQHALSFYEDEITDGKNALKSDLELTKKRTGSLTAAVKELVRSGMFLIYTDDKRLFLMKTLNEDPDYAGQFSDDQVNNLYENLIVRDVASMYRGEL